MIYYYTRENLNHSVVHGRSGRRYGANGYLNYQKILTHRLTRPVKIAIKIKKIQMSGFLVVISGNLTPIRRYCMIPEHKAILFPILEKEDSFAEDTDLKLKSELRLRAKEFMDRVRDLRLVIDGTQV